MDLPVTQYAEHRKVDKPCCRLNEEDIKEYALRYLPVGPEFAEILQAELYGKQDNSGREQPLGFVIDVPGPACSPGGDYQRRRK